MFANRYTVVLDACVLVPPLARNLLLSLAHGELYRAKWSEMTLEETHRGIIRDLERKQADQPQARADKALAEMRRAFPEAMVEDYEAYIAGLKGPDDNDLEATGPRDDRLNGPGAGHALTIHLGQSEGSAQRRSSQWTRGWQCINNLPVPLRGVRWRPA